MQSRAPAYLTATCLAALLTLPASPTYAQAPGSSTPTPELAKTADSFVDSIGINIKLEYQDTPYWDFDKLDNVLVQSGIRNVRVGLSGDPGIQQKILKLHADGIDSTALVFGDALVPGDGPQTEFLRRMAALSPAIVMLEGPNEADAGFSFDGKQFPESLDEYQQILYRTAKASQYSAIPVIAPSISFPPKSAQVPNLPCDFANIHSYHGANNPGTDAQNLDLPKFYLANSAIVSPGKIVVCTETGNPTSSYADPSLWMPRTSEWAQGKYAVRTYLEYYRDGIVRTFIHELIDEHPNPHLDEQNFGIVRNDWSPKPAFTGLSNMISILKDPGATFTPKTLTYSLDGDVADVHHVLLQKRDGTFYLALWKEVKSYDPPTHQDVGVADSTVQLHVLPSQYEGVYSYQPMGWSTPSSLIAADSAGTVNLSVGDEPTILQLLPAGADIVVTSAGPVGGIAQSGVPVKLQGVIMNRGTATTPAGLLLTVTFFDMSSGTPKMVTYSATNYDALAPGQSVTLISDGKWTPQQSGHLAMDALVDDQQRIPETDRSNDHFAFSVDVK